MGGASDEREKTMTASERLADLGYEDVIIFDSPSFDKALIGVSEDNRAIYDYEKMAICLAVDWAVSLEEAIEFIEYNTIRALPYAGAGAPIILHRLPE
jgi:hypothetical protein